MLQVKAHIPKNIFLGKIALLQSFSSTKQKQLATHQENNTTKSHSRTSKTNQPTYPTQKPNTSQSNSNSKEIPQQSTDLYIQIKKIRSEQSPSEQKIKQLEQEQLQLQSQQQEKVKQEQEHKQIKQTKELHELHAQQGSAWKAQVKAFGERNGLTFLAPLSLEEAVSHRFTIHRHHSAESGSLCNDRLAFYGQALAELQLAEYYLDVLPRGVQLATRICLKKSNLYAAGQRIGLDKLLHHRFLSTNSYELVHPLSEPKRLEIATAETILALLAAIHLHHKAAKTTPTPLFSHKLIALPLTLPQLIKQHRPRQVLDAYLRTRPRPSHIAQTQPWSAQTQPPVTAHSMFAIYKVLESTKGSSNATVGVYIDGKLLTTEHGATVYEAEEMAAVRALDLLRSNVFKDAIASLSADEDEGNP